MSPRMSEKELLDRLAELPREMNPARDPWPGIAAGIRKSPLAAGARRKAGNWWFGAAAAAVVLVFSAGLLLKPLINESAPVTRAMVETRPDPSMNNALGFDGAGIAGLLNAVDAEYLAAFREFISAGDSRGGLAPQTIEKIELGWADMRVAEQALADALEQNPDDLFLNERMLELRARQLDFFRQLVSIDRNNRRLTI